MWREASYTVEASWVISISLVIIGALMVLGYEVYHEALLFAKNVTYTIDVVSMFRKGWVLDELLQIGR